MVHLLKRMRIHLGYLNGHIVNGKIDDKKLKYLPQKHEDVKKLVLEENDFLFNRTNSYELVGKTAILEAKYANNVTFASYFIRVRLFDKEF